MITLTVNDEKEEGQKSIWTLRISAEGLDGPCIIGIFSKICAANGFKIEMEQLKLKG